MLTNLFWPLIIKENLIDMINIEKRISADDSDNIFFIESNNDLVKFHPRLLCAFESAAIHNPNKLVNIILRIQLTD